MYRVKFYCIVPSNVVSMLSFCNVLFDGVSCLLRKDIDMKFISITGPSLMVNELSPSTHHRNDMLEENAIFFEKVRRQQCKYSFDIENLSFSIISGSSQSDDIEERHIVKSNHIKVLSSTSKKNDSILELNLALFNNAFFKQCSNDDGNVKIASVSIWYVVYFKLLNIFLT